MTTITDLAASVWRDWTIDGVPSSGVRPVPKADVRAVMAAIDEQKGQLDRANVWTEKNTYSAFMTGTVTAPTVRLVSIELAETMTNLTASSTIDGLFISHIFSTGQASRNGLRVDLTNSGPTAGAGADQHAFYTGIMSNVTVAASDGGGPGDYKGDFYGVGVQAVLQSGATYIDALCGAELDIGAQAGSSVSKKIGLLLLNAFSDAVKGSTIDAMMVLAKDSSSSVEFDKGISFGMPGAKWPIEGTGTLIGTYATVDPMEAANGVDFSAISFSGSAFKSAGFNVQTGLVTIDGLSSSSLAQLVVGNGGVNGGGIQIADGTNGKFLRVLSNTFAILNSAYSTALLTLTDAGNLAVTGTGQFSGQVGIGAVPSSSAGLVVTRNIQGSTLAFGVVQNGAVQSAVTSQATGYRNTMNTAAASFTLPNYFHFHAVQGTIGASSAVTSQDGFIADGGLIGATTNYGFRALNAAAVTSGKTNIAFYTDQNIATGGGATWGFYGAGTAANRFGGANYFPGVGTTASAANAVLDSGSTPANSLLRSTSSIIYKRDVETLDSERADHVIRNARPIWYRSKAKADRDDWGWYGLLAEELAEVDPRLVTWGYQDHHWETYEITPAWVEHREDDEGEERVVEHSAQMGQRLKDGAEKVPDGVAYDRLTVMLLDVVRRHGDRITAIETTLH